MGRINSQTRLIIPARVIVGNWISQVLFRSKLMFGVGVSYSVASVYTVRSKDRSDRVSVRVPTIQV